MAGKFEVKAGQHIFKGGEKVNVTLPTLVAYFNPKSDICPIKQIYADIPSVNAPPVSDENTSSFSGESNLNATPTGSSVVKCSSHIPKKSEDNYSLKFPVKDGYPVDKQGNKISNVMKRWESISRRKFDIVYDPTLNKITANVILQVTFLDSVKKINGVDTSVPFNQMEMSQTIQRSIPRAYNASVMAGLKVKIEQTLNKEIKYLTPQNCNQAGGCSCKIPIFLTVDFVEKGRFHQKINIYPLSDRPNTDNWCEVRLYGINPRNPNYTPIPANEDHSLAHEVGHYYNFVDEYYFEGGMIHKMYIDSGTKMVNLNTPDAIDNWVKYSQVNLMGGGSKSLSPVIPKYYYEFMKEWFDQKTRIQWNIVL